MSQPSCASAPRRSTRPLSPKLGDRRAGARVDRGQEARALIEEPAVGAVRALPVVHPARADRALVRMGPQLLTGRGVERDDLVVAREHVHHAVHDDRVEHEAALAGREGPRHLELRDVRLVDLLQRGVLRRVRAAAVGSPGVVRLRVRGADREQRPPRRRARRVPRPAFLLFCIGAPIWVDPRAAAKATRGFDVLQSVPGLRVSARRPTGSRKSAKSNTMAGGIFARRRPRRI